MNGEDLNYWSLQGEFNLHEIVNGFPGAGFWLGDCSSIEYSATPETEKFKENHSGTRGTGYTQYNGTEAQLTITLHNANTKQLTLLLGGDTQAQDPAAVVDELLIATPVVGQMLLLGGLDVSAVVIKDSTPTTPKTLTAGVNYTINPKTGTLKIIDLTAGGPFVGPLTKSYTPGAVTYVKMLTNTQRRWWARFNGLNTAQSLNDVWVGDWYQFETLPSSLQLINESRGEAVLTGTIYSDTTKPADGAWGQFGRMAIID